MISETMRAYRGDQLEVFEKTRDTDGTVDRVPDPPEALKKWLLLLKMKNTSAGIGLAEMLRLQGAKANGVMDRGTFLITLRTVYKEWSFQEQLLFSFAHTYGCGLVDGSGLKESVAWRDFCEDVELQDEKDADDEIRLIIRGRICEIGAGPKMYDP
uniref:Uncharacterized protein n=1 Tax=Haptolina ericina TaxID=156174 RepID=A0A7S3AE82_9EUKA|mmetsp:Transcript_14372/g.32289  ORF Transcript_14372/g.32289 Transcript_14372/m.32289 type:complete len:156 (+) Transcript_14372:43-510(+)